MSSFLKKMLLASVVLGMGFGAVACSDDDDSNETITPKIFEEVSNIWEKANCENSAGVINCTKQCSAVHAVIKDVKGGKDIPMRDACDEYQKSREAHKGKPENLTTDMDNSGYYLSTFILLNNMQKNFYSCTQDTSKQEDIKRDWENLFKEKGCGSILEDAETIVKKRGK